MDDRSCMSYWYPRIRGRVPTPRTELLILDEDEGWEMAEVMDGEVPDVVQRVCAWIKGAAQIVGGYPVFLRTGQGSGKHEWRRTCHLRSAVHIAQHVFNLIEWSHCVDMFGLRHNVWAVRKMLPTHPLFRCTAYGDMPVVVEHRFFVRDGRIQCWHPYWPEDSLETGRPDDMSWRMHLPTLQQQPSLNAVLAAEAAGQVVGGGYWSVDVLPAAGVAYVTDMAEGERSWHWPDCKFAP